MSVERRRAMLEAIAYGAESDDGARLRALEALDRYGEPSAGLAFSDEVARIPEPDLPREVAVLRRAAGSLSAPREAWAAVQVRLLAGDAVTAAEAEEVLSPLVARMIAERAKEIAGRRVVEETASLRDRLGEANAEIASLRRQVAKARSERVVVVEQAALPRGRVDEPGREGAGDQLEGGPRLRELPPGIDPNAGWPEPGGSIFRRIGRR